MKGENERCLYEALNEAWPGHWVSEYQGIEGRKFRFDAANPSLKICIEVEGSIWTFGRHNQPMGYIKDLEKYNLATLEGWKILRYTTDTVRKNPQRIIADVRKLCGDEKQTKLPDGLKQVTL